MPFLAHNSLYEECKAPDPCTSIHSDWSVSPYYQLLNTFNIIPCQVTEEENIVINNLCTFLTAEQKPVAELSINIYETQKTPFI